MAKVIFIQKEAAEKFGVMSLSAVLKQAGHQTRMYIQLLERGKIDSTLGSSAIKNPDKKEIENLRKLSWMTVKLPWLFSLAKKFVYLPDNVLFDLLLKVSETYSFKRRYRLGIGQMFRLAWGTGKTFG